MRSILTIKSGAHHELGILLLVQPFRWTYRYLGKLGVEGINSNLATFIRTIVVLLVTAGIISARNEWQLPQHITAKPFTFLILSGVATGLSWLCYYRALQMAPASWVAPIDKLSVVDCHYFRCGIVRRTLKYEISHRKSINSLRCFSLILID